MSVLVAALADAALLLPAAMLLIAYAAVLREGRLALALAAGFATSGLATVAFKLVFHACGHEIAGGGITSPSGHVSFATIFYGSLAILLGTGRTVTVRASLAIGTALFLAAVGVSRVRTGAHTPTEVLLGLLIGAGALAVFAGLHRWAGRPGVPLLPVALGFAAAVVLIGGSHFSLEGRIIRTARQLSAQLDVCSPPPRRRYLSGRS